MKNAVVIDAYSQANYHEVINQGYLMMIAQLYDSVTYIAEERSCDNMKRLLDECNADYSNVVFSPKTIRKPQWSIRLLAKLYWFFKVSWLNYYFFMKTRKCEDVFFNNNIHLAILLIHFLSFGKKNRIFDLCHAEMEMIDKKEAYTPSRFLGSWIYRTAFCRLTLRDNMRFILLSPDMVHTFRKQIKEENRRLIHWIDHCYIRTKHKFSGTINDKSSADTGKEMLQKANGKLQKADGKLRIGVLGAITKERGYSVISALLNRIDGSKCHLYSVSYTTEKIDNPHFTALNQSRKLLSYDEYGSYVSSMDVVLLPYEKDSYMLTASGAALEAIWQNKPIFAIRNGYVDYLFRKFGSLGRLYDDVESLAADMSTITRESLAQYSDNIEKARQCLLPQNTVGQLREIVTP